MKKPIASLALAAALLLLTGCSLPTPDSGASTAGEETPSDETATAAPAAPAAEEQETADSDYAVTIDGSRLGTDYEGKPAILVDYTFANNSDSEQSFMFAVSAKAFQNGVELELAIGTEADSSQGLLSIKPGASLPVTEAYVLSDQSDVTVEVSELISFDDALIASQVFSVQ